MILFSDLDQTLIYSHRHKISGEKIPVEYLNEKEQSYITTANLVALKGYCKNNLFVPITTRSVPQYERLDILYKQLRFPYALICNGAILLKDNKPDSEWTADSIKLTENFQPTIKSIYLRLKKIADVEHIHYIVPFMVYVKTDDTENIYRILKSEYGNTKIEILKSDRKIYCIPEILSKGKAVLRFMEKYGNNCHSFAIGDSSFDISMMNECNYAFAPLALNFTAKNIIKLNTPFEFTEIFKLMKKLSQKLDNLKNF